MERLLELEDFKGMATMIGAVVAGLTGLFNIYLQVRGKRDRFSLSPYSYGEADGPAEYMHVVNLSDHTIRIADWGWIDADMKLASGPSEMLSPDFYQSQQRIMGSTDLENRSDIFEVRYVRKEPIGAFARSATQATPKLAFKYNVSKLTILRTRLRILLLGRNYYR